MAWQGAFIIAKSHDWTTPTFRTKPSLFQELLLGGCAIAKDRQFGSLGNHILATYGSPTLGNVLPPSSEDLSDLVFMSSAAQPDILEFF